MDLVALSWSGHRPVLRWEERVGSPEVVGPQAVDGKLKPLMGCARKSFIKLVFCKLADRIFPLY